MAVKTVFVSSTDSRVLYSPNPGFWIKICEIKFSFLSVDKKKKSITTRYVYLKCKLLGSRGYAEW